MIVLAFHCERCGVVVKPQRASKRTRLCAECTKTPAAALAAPPHAVAHHDRGLWVLRCQADGCDETFIACRQARRCPACRLNTTTASRRRPLRDHAETTPTTRKGGQ